MRSPGTYQISETLFTSLSSCVYRANRNADHRAVILRTCGEQASPSQRVRLSTSAEILKNFDHPNIVKLIDCFEFSGQPCLVMDDTKSIDLWRYAEKFKDKKLSVETVLNIAIQIADALSIIHHAQVIHKDLHPGNIVINSDTLNVQIIDFGLASLLSREQPALAPPENLEGILSYISPEQTGRMNRSLDYRTDFYTLGVTLYQLLTGRLPFEADDAIGLVHAHIARVQAPVSELCSEVPKVVSDIIDKLMHKTAEKRYQSALGLKQDLEICSRHVLAGTGIPSFILGLNDVSDRFQLPQVLYGREREVKQLMDSFYLAVKGQAQLLAIEGFAGIGKSALVHEVHKVIALHSGIFINGKFDQFQKNVPYSALKQIFSAWIQHVMSLNEAALLALKNQLNQALGANARVLIDFLEAFELVLGDLAPLPSLGALETQNRFHLVLQRFIHLITQDRPLVIFIDDLQWADRGTLNLLPLLMSTDSRLLFLVAYRDNEVDENHPAITTLAQIRQENSSADTLTLQALPVEQVNQLLVDSLHQRNEVTLPLAELVHIKTGGNPFFVNEFLKTLYSKKLLDFNLKRQKWHWDLKEIKSQDITNNVVELMLGKMQQLPEKTQKLLQLASCIGSQFDLQTLSIISEQHMSDTVKQLWPALKEGLLLQEGGDWLLGATERQGSEFFKKRHESSDTVQLSTRMSPLVPHCRFLHDRMLQAAYQSLSENACQQAHLSIGRLIFGHTDTAYLEDRLFTIIGQLNLGRVLIETETERLHLAQLNWNAADKAKLASAWDASAQYAEIGLALLPSECWKAHYDLTFGLYHIFAECQYLRGKPEQSEKLYDTLLANTVSGLDKAQICSDRLVQTIGAGQWHKGIKIGILGLKYSGVEVPTDPEKVRLCFQQELEKFEQSLINLPVNQFINLPEMTDPQLLMISTIIPNLSQCSFILGKPDFQKFLIAFGLNIMLDSGRSSRSPLLMACYAIILAEDQPSLAYDIANQAIKLSERYTTQTHELANTYNVLAGLIVYLKSPYQDAIDLHQKGYALGLDNGEVARAALNYCNILFLSYSKGDVLSAVLKHAEHTFELVNKKAIFFPVPVITKMLVSALVQGETEGGQALDDKQFDADYLSQIQSGFHITHLNNYRSQLAFWFDDDERSINYARQVQNKISQLPKFSLYIDHLVQYALLLASALNDDLVQTCQRDQEDLDFCLTKLKTLAELYPPNFEHKYLLLQAELGRYKNQPMEQLAEQYETAINSASKNGFLQYEALANELFASYWLSKNLNKTALTYLNDALYLYRLWGCNIKVNQLGLRYQWLLQGEQLNHENRDSRHVSILPSSNSMQTSTQTSSQEGLDLLSVMKSAQAISGELEIKGLLAKVMLAIMENSGAQNGALILDNPQGTVIEASLKTQPRNEINLESRPLENAKDVPVSLISYVLRTDSDLILQDANSAFIEDPYLQKHQPKSVLCIPVDYREKIIGALYLENPLIHNAFPQERLHIIKMLLTQATISFENARLFNEVSELNTGLEEKVQQRTQKLNETVKELESANQELDSFSYSVSHDLRAPLRKIRGFSHILVEDYQAGLAPEAQVILNKVIAGTESMSNLVSGLLDLSRVQKKALVFSEVSISDMAEAIIKNLREHAPERKVNVIIEPNMHANGDQRMLDSVFENLLNNAWKYTSKTRDAEISFTSEQQNNQTVYIIKDNGAGFDMKNIDKLFITFQRLHSDKEFQGTGVGLATVKRVINKHGGKIWAKAEIDHGATFYFTIGLAVEGREQEA